MDNNETQVVISVVGLLTQVVTIIGGAFVAYLAYKAKKIGEKNAEKLEIVHAQTNSMKDELVKEVRRSATAEGAAVGRKEAVDEIKTQNQM